MRATRQVATCVISSLLTLRARSMNGSRKLSNTINPNVQLYSVANNSFFSFDFRTHQCECAIKSRKTHVVSCTLCFSCSLLCVKYVTIE